MVPVIPVVKTICAVDCIADVVLIPACLSRQKLLLINHQNWRPINYTGDMHAQCRPSARAFNRCGLLCTFIEARVKWKWPNESVILRSMKTWARWCMPPQDKHPRFGSDICIPHEKSRTCSWRDLKWEGFYAGTFVVAASLCFLLQSVKKKRLALSPIVSPSSSMAGQHTWNWPSLWELSYKGPATPCAVCSEIALLSVTHTTAPSPQCNIKIGVCDVRG